MHSPVEQFTIKTLMHIELFGYDVSFSNSALFMMLTVILSVAYLTFAMRNRDMVPGRLQASAEMLYEFVSEMVRAMLAAKVARTSVHLHPVYFPIVREYAGVDPIFIHIHKPDRCDLCSCGFHLCRRDAGCLD